mmetsp:Transcript_101854/g.263810  ORF Transcript_101854/g.263810 Transcript_101854/m.263810 type:complete len:592 (-) Transcript_101854:138-1913(-)
MATSTAPLSLPLAASSFNATGEGGSSAYVPVAGAGSPCSNTGSPTAREVRLECKGNANEQEGPVVITEGKVAQPFRQRLLLIGCVLGLLLAAAVAAVFLCRVWPAPVSGPRYKKISAGTCAEHGLIPLRTADLCSAAARELHLSDTEPSEVPQDAVDGLLDDGLPQHCYYLIEKEPEHKETLWLNPHATHPRKLHSASVAQGTAEVAAMVTGLRRESLCGVPLDQQHQQARALPKEVDVIPDAIAGLIFGTTTTTTTTTMTTTSTVTGTTSTLTSTTKTITSTTPTSTTTTSSTLTTSMTTTYHTEPSLFCFSVMRVNSYELNNVRTALGKRTSIFACDDYIVFSDQEYTIVPGLPQPGMAYLQDVQGMASVKTTLLRHDLATHAKAGSLEGILNTRIFMQAWKQIDEAGIFRLHDWTIKVDPDAVFLPGRLRSDLAEIAPASSSPNLYLVNCKISFGLFGAVEVFSRVALEKYIAGTERCKNELDWTMMGEDLWMRKCFDLLGVQHQDDFNLLSDGYCSDAPSPCQSGKVTFHPFKSALSYLQCYTEAIAPTTTSTTVTTSTVTSTTRTTSRRAKVLDEYSGELDAESEE